MAHQNHASDGIAGPNKLSSRLASLRMFKPKSGSTSSDSSTLPPPPPPKDTVYNISSNSPSNPPSAFYAKSLFSRSVSSLSPSLSRAPSQGQPLSPDSNPVTPLTAGSFGVPQHGSTGTQVAILGRGMTASPVPSGSGVSLRSVSGGGEHMATPSVDGSTDSSDMNATKSKKALFKLSSLGKRNKSRRDLSESASTSEYEGSGKEEGDEGISMPWNFQHHIHVDEGYIGLPPSWATALSTAGFSEEEIAAIHARRKAAAGTNLKNGSNAASPHTQYSSARPASPVLRNPLPRSSSLARLRIDSPSTHSAGSGSGLASATGGNPSPSPRVTGFGVRALIPGGFLGSKGGDNASTAGGNRRRNGVNCAGSGVGEESEPYVMVDGDVDAAEGVGDETLIEPFPYDAASIITHHTHSSQVPSQAQTPRGPQAQRTQSDTGNVPFPSPGTPIRGAPPLTQSTSLSVPSPRVHANSSPSLAADSSIYHGSASPSPSPSHSLSGQPTASSALRTPPRRVYHVANASSDSSYGDPPPAYASPVRGEIFRREKEGPHQTPTCAGSSSPPPTRSMPPIPIPGIAERSQASKCNTSAGSSSGRGTAHDGLYDIDPFDASDIPATVEDVLDISATHSSLYLDNDDAEQHGIDIAMQRQRLLSPTPPLVIDKRLTRAASLMTQPPRISFHQESSLEDWTSSLFSAISSDDATDPIDSSRSNLVAKSRTRLTVPQETEEDEKAERRLTLRPASPPPAPKVTSSPMSPAPKLPDVSFGRNISIGEHVRQARPLSPEKTEVEVSEAEAVGVTKGADEPRELLSISSPSLPDVSFGPNVSSLGKDLLPSVVSPSPSPSANEPNSESGAPACKLKPRPSLPSLGPPKPNATISVDGKSPVSPFLRCGPKPLPLPIPPDQIRAQLRPSKSDHSRSSSQAQAPNSQLQTPSQPSPVILSVEPSSQCSSRRESSSSLAPRSNPGDRDSGVSTVTVTQATIVMVKGQAVRRAVASVIDPDLISPPSASQRDSFASAFGVSRGVLDAHANKDMAYEPKEEEHELERPDDDADAQSLLISGTGSGPPSSPSPTWPAPPPPPKELDTDATPRPVSRFRTTSLQRVSQITGLMGGIFASPRTSHFPHMSSETTSSSESVPLPTPKGVLAPPPPLPKGKGIAPEARMLISTTDTFGGVDVESEDEVAESLYTRSASSRKSSVGPSLRSVASSQSQLHSPITSSPRRGAPIPSTTVPHPLLAPLHAFINPIDPSTRFTELVEIAEGESGSVYAARILQESSPSRPSFSTERPIPAGTSRVAIKRILIPQTSSAAMFSGEGSTADESFLMKIASLQHELTLLKNLEHEHILLLDGVYVHTGADVNEGEDSSGEYPSASRAIALDTSLWIRMELMERSLADVIALVAEGLALQERMVARFTSDVLLGLDYLQKQHIAHRDVRSDNLLLNAAGAVKIADFSNAIRVTESAPTVTGAVGVIYWQAPEMRAGPYDALKVDVWSVGATVWELAETVPPFSIPASPSSQTAFLPPNSKHLGSQWPPLSHPEHYSKGFHDFLRLCGTDATARPCPRELLNTQFILNACGRAVIRQLLTQCRSMEETLLARDNAASLS